MNITPTLSAPLRIATLLLATSAVLSAHAQPYPKQAVTVIVPVSAGGTDFMRSGLVRWARVAACAGMKAE
jgi:mitochondrial fission protein ELM1